MKTFKDLGLNEQIQQSLDEFGYIEPTPIQAQTIPFILSGDQDLIGLAQTGTGKTAAFGLPILHKLLPGSDLQAIILCPTRELCLQISREISGFARYVKGVSVATVYGGARIDQQIRELRAGANIIVGTPGRVHDLIRRKILKLQTIRLAVLDEADEMLDLGFKDDLDAILTETPRDKQTLLFSATMSANIANIAKRYMRDAHEIAVAKKNVGADNIIHQYYLVKPGQKFEALRRIVDSEPDIYGILFCRTRNETQEIAEKLKESHYSTEALHGDISQNLRTQIMDRFRQRKIQLLVATDVAARGIDVNDLTHVINYNLPDVNEAYVHRSGRTGRAQKSGVSISILTMREMHKIRPLEQKVGKTFECKQVPTGQEICEKQLLNLVDKMKNIEVDEEAINRFLPAIEDRLSGLSQHQLLARFVSVEFNHFLNLYKDARDLDSVTAEKGSTQRGNRQPAENFISVRLNIGKKDQLDIRTLFGLINSQRELKGAEIGKVALNDTFTIFGLDKKYERDLPKAFKNTRFRGRLLEIKIVVDRDFEPKHKRSAKKGKPSQRRGSSGHQRKFKRGFNKKTVKD